MPSFAHDSDSHYHGIPSFHVADVLDAIKADDPLVSYVVGDKDADFAIVTVTLSHGFVDCDLRGPVVGDAPILEADVSYAVRPGVSYRDWESRITPMDPTRTNKVTVLASAEGIITMFGGPLAPQENGDPSKHDAEASKAFWATHALSHESLTREA
jgi:hypothetical protein